MKKFSLLFLLLFSFLSYSQILIDERLSLEIIDTQPSNFYEGCIGTVTFQYEIQTTGVDYLIRRKYLHNNNIYDYPLTGEEVTLGIHQKTLNIGWDSSFNLLGGEGSIGPGRNGAFISSVLNIDRCETKAHIINSDFTTNQLQVVIEDSDPNYAYRIFETSENSTLESTGIVFGNNILSTNGTFDLNLTTNPERLIELHEGPTSSNSSFPDWVPGRISQMSSLEIRPNNGIELSFEESTSNSSGQITSGTVTINISEDEYESSAYYYLDILSIYPDINITDIITGAGTFQIPNIAISDIDTTVTLRKCIARCNHTRPTTIALARIYIDIFPNDFDNDGIQDIDDNCPDIANTDQADNDFDGVGNVCDNCPDDDNTNQADNDNDDIGNVCDNCPDESNQNQFDTDNDGIGDACDDDIDGDGIINENDNCPNTANANQEDSDNDGIGDACDEVKPDLFTSTNNVLITSECNDCPILLSDLGSDKHKITPNGIMVIQSAVIENINSATAPSSKVKYYISTDSTIDSTDFELPIETSIPSISSNSSYLFSETIFGQHFPALTFGDYKLLVKLDGDDDVDESNENNNKFSVSIKWTSSTTDRLAFLDLGNNIIEISLSGLGLQLPTNTNLTNINSIGNKPLLNSTYSLKIYNLGILSPIPVINQAITNGQTINVSHLPNGFYVVHIDNVYVLKFAKFSKTGFLKP